MYPALDVLVGEIAGSRPLSPVAARVLAITESERFSAHELAQAISSDPSLTARVLRLANSPYYGFPRRMSTVRDAVVLLGFRPIRSTALAVSVVDAFPRTGGQQHDAFWRHSVTVAVLADLLARADGEHPDEAFTAGILHNIGRLALDQVYPGLMRQATALADEEGIPLEEAERLLLGFTDAELGGALALEWRFPLTTGLAVANHQRPLESLGQSSDALAARVARARTFARSLGVSDGPTQPARTTPACEWSAPPLAPLLEHAGGVDGLARRVSVFLEAVSAGP